MSRSPVSSLLSRLYDVGAMITAQGDHLLIDAPRGAVNEEHRQILAERKPEVLALLRSQERILSMTLGQFEKTRCCLEVRVPGLSETLWFVSGDAGVQSLLAEGVRRGRIWTAGELRDLLAAPGMTHEDALPVARAKLAFNATVADVRPAEPEIRSTAPTEEPHGTEPVQASLELDAPATREFD